jgi:hypothetical protein
LLSLKEEAAKVIQQVSTPISEVVEAVSNKAAETFEKFIPTDGNLRREGLENMLQELKEKIEYIEEELKSEQLRQCDRWKTTETTATTATSQIEQTKTSVRFHQNNLYDQLKDLNTKYQKKESNDGKRFQGLDDELKQLDQEQKTKDAEKTKDLIKVKFEITKLKASLGYLNENFQETRRENDAAEEPDEEEPGIALEDQLRITEQSAKAIDLLSSHLLSTVWQPCSKNSFGKCILESRLFALFFKFNCAHSIFRFLHPDYVALWFSLQKTAYPRDSVSNYSRLPDSLFFSCYANYPRILPLDKTPPDISRSQRPQCLEPRLSRHVQWAQLFRLVCAAASGVPVPELSVRKRRLPHSPHRSAGHHRALPLQHPEQHSWRDKKLPHHMELGPLHLGGRGRHYEVALLEGVAVFAQVSGQLPPIPLQRVRV